MAGGVMPIGNLPGKVNSANALVVTLDGGAVVGTLATITQDAIGVTTTDGLVLQNTTDAAAGAQQMSPRIRFHGEGWKTNATAASQTVDIINEFLPVEGAAAPTANLLWKYSVNGGAYTTVMTLTSAGDLTVSDGNITVGNNRLFISTGRGGLAVGTTGDGLHSFLNTASSAGVGIDVATDAVLKIRTRAQTAYATVDCLGLKASGAAGASFGPAGVTSITVVNGIVTAIS